MTSPEKTPASTEDDAVYSKVAWKLIPLLFFCYILAYLDRVNVGFAKLGMTDELWFSDAVYATGAGIFFLGYFVFEVPANILLHRWGARRCIARIMISWGILSSLCAVSSSGASFYTLRFLLGVAEAGFFPGIILYLTYWFPQERRARMIALFMTAIPLAGVIGSPLSGWLLEVAEGWGGMKAWQWLFVVEGLPSVLVGLTVPFFLTDRPKDATWLSDEEKRLIVTKLESEDRAKRDEDGGSHSVGDAFRSPLVWLFCLIYLGVVVGIYGVSFWLPQIVENSLTTVKWQVGLYAAVPWAFGAVGMVLVGRHSDRTGERRWHIALPLVAGAIGLVCSTIPGIPPSLLLAFLSMAVIGIMSALACFWTLPTAALSGAAAAVGIAWINSVGNLAGYLSPEMVARLKARYDLGVALDGIALVLLLTAALVLLYHRIPFISKSLTTHKRGE